ncbi:unnamed protein product [Plasmodium vivax]|uniref:(malaria parasite P. vivax) hypothetical protein n=1 Tax=Plasmodium vivax TaxID=5855 RepID=A0A8S4HCY4_PLAVI|nr:unnamed protein product [Plasmodium vivax]
MATWQCNPHQSSSFCSSICSSLCSSLLLLPLSFFFPSRVNFPKGIRPDISLNNVVLNSGGVPPYWDHFEANHRHRLRCHGLT